jgi:hypothetical protein
MTLKLHKELAARLIELLTNSLPNLQVQNGKYFLSGTRMSLFEADNALPDHGNLRDQLDSFVDDFPILTFVYDVLQANLMDLDRYDSDLPLQKLTEIEEFSDTPSLARHLIEQFESLPWRYTLSVQLPHDVSAFLAANMEEARRLSPTMALVKATDALTKKYPLNCSDKGRQKRIHGAGSILLPKTEDEKWSEKAVYLQIEVDGFIGPFGGSVPAIQAERLLKSFLGLGIALRLFQVGSVYSFVPPVEHFFVHKAQDDTWVIDSKLELNSDQSRVLSEIKLNNMITDAPNEERRKQLLKIILDEMSAVFAAGEKSESIVLAAEWHLDSYTGRDARLNYVQSMVVLEVLLGDKANSDAMGLGQLLRNRCAYLIGKNQEERNSLMKEFDEIYKIRSQIVHRGKARLSFKEGVLFSKLRSICNRVIQREVDLLQVK